MKKFLYTLSICLVAVFSVFCFTGCSIGGESAYQIAVRNGYTGTESQWLESLKGTNGQNGADGVSYEDIKALYDDLVARGEFTGSFLDFVKQYLNVYDIGVQDAVNNCIRSAVSVSAYYTYNGTEYISGGGGVIYQIDKTNNLVYVITNYHVVYVYQNKAVANEICVNLYGSESDYASINCSYLGGSEAFDIAILKIEGSQAQKIINSDAKAVTVGKFDDYSLGQSVFAIGNPMLEGITVVSGIVSADNRDVIYSISSKQYTHRCFQIDATINSGNSGGGVFNAAGEWIGIANAKYMSYLESDGSVESVEGMSYAIPVQHAVAIADYVIKNCDGSSNKVMKTYKLGVSYATADSKMVYNTTSKKTEIVESVAIKSVDANSVASRIGLESEDILQSVKVTKASGKVIEFKITRGYLFKDALMFAENGDSVAFVVTRNGVTKNLNYTLSSSDAGSLVQLENK